MNRELIKNKFGGLCAYTGKPLGEDWQIDHIKPKRMGGTNDIQNLVPTIKIINHYKRGLGLEGVKSQKMMIVIHMQGYSLSKQKKSEINS